jgi:hypothetical protein
VSKPDYRCEGIYCEKHGTHDACNCEPCACGHCIHEHEKWRWHRACRVCTPLLYADEVPNEVDPRPLGTPWTPETPPVNLCGELDKHRPAGQPLVRCKR